MTKRTSDHIATRLLLIADAQNRLARLKASGWNAKLEIARSQIHIATSLDLLAKFLRKESAYAVNTAHSRSTH